MGFEPVRATPLKRHDKGLLAYAQPQLLIEAARRLGVTDWIRSSLLLLPQSLVLEIQLYDHFQVLDGPLQFV